ncbi:hypothetical protein ABID08_002072 [Rhizobium binae]|uniref:DUF2190 family protein n=1 Tax=Rhizobium binae TaxID=1138190 RepID=A0ABV2ME18_9HYPH|nr:hypothetical protein [Rhizobium binae]MBX4992899.1 hypothetical protein [Rhizobium binae]NKL47203.1 hypothetical protein [Rhizobium leguminosarum bv. viciae]QSY84161.1 hypothetical protein J2J99_10420 [Rhizobium binae]
MADLVIVAANVVAGADSSAVTGVAGETITAGKAVYLSSTTKKWMLADSNSVTAEARQAKGIALNGASLNQPIAVHKSGEITIGATLVAGTAYYLSDTAGGICPLADVGAGEYVCLLGLAKSTTVLAVDIQFPNVSL